jgi:hypothetical protein
MGEGGDEFEKKRFHDIFKLINTVGVDKTRVLRVSF